MLDAAAVTELARLGARAEEHLGAPQDVEWVRADGVFALVQARPITALPEPAAPPPQTWPLPYPKGAYFRASIVEQLPDPLTPLLADLIGPAVTDSIGELMSSLLGRPIRPGDVSFPTVNGYAYYFCRTAGLIRVTLSMPLALRGLARSRTRGGVRGWEQHAHPAYVGAVGRWGTRDLTALSPDELLDGVVALLRAGAVTAPARVVRGPADFAALAPGEVLVARLTPRPGPRCSPARRRWSPTSAAR